MTALFRKILVPYDFSDAARGALAIAVDLAAAHRGTLTVLHAIAPVYPVSTYAGAGEMPIWVPTDDVRGETRRRLEAEVGRIVGKRVAGVACRVVLGDPHGCIIAAARTADSIVMGTLGRTGLSHLVIGSVAEKVVRYAPVPVLTIRPAALRRARRGRPGKASPRTARPARRRRPGATRARTR